MAVLEKDSAILELFAAEDGYYIRVWKWDQSPAPVPFRDLDSTTPQATFRQDRISTTKDELKTEFGTFLDNIFDM